MSLSLPVSPVSVVMDSFFIISSYILCFHCCFVHLMFPLLLCSLVCCHRLSFDHTHFLISFHNSLVQLVLLSIYSPACHQFGCQLLYVSWMILCFTFVYPSYLVFSELVDYFNKYLLPSLVLCPSEHHYVTVSLNHSPVITLKLL